MHCDRPSDPAVLAARRDGASPQTAPRHGDVEDERQHDNEVHEEERSDILVPGHPEREGPDELLRAGSA